MLSDAQSQTQSGTLVGPNLREQVEDVRQRLGFESASGVTHTHSATVVSRPRRGQMDPAPRFSVLHSIVEQIRQDLPEAFWIGVDPQRRGRDRDDEVMAARSDRGARVQRGVRDRLPHIHPLQLQRQSFAHRAASMRSWTRRVIWRVCRWMISAARLAAGDPETRLMIATAWVRAESG